MKKRNCRISSTDKKNQLHLAIWEPDEYSDEEIRGVVQISHGMVEYMERYQGLAEFLTNQGYVVAGNDHLGHGHSAASDRDLGYFAKKCGSRILVRDLRRVTAYLKHRYPEKPFFLLGHSMGSFLARNYAMKYGDELDGLILIGTGAQPQAALTLGQRLIELLKQFRGDRYRSSLLYKLCFATYNSKIHPKRTEYDWISRDESIVDAYAKDKFCTFRFTLNGYEALFQMIEYIQNPSHEEKIPKKLPIFFLTGSSDPVGHYGKDIRELSGRYRELGIKDVTFRIYYGARHELLNELEYDRTQKDILEWLNKHRQTNQEQNQIKEEILKELKEELKEVFQEENDEMSILWK